MMPCVLITGGTGLLGTALSRTLLAKGYRVIILTRKIPAEQPVEGMSYALWDVKTQTIDIGAVQRCQYIIHLAGAGVLDKKWTAAYKEEIVKSRVDSSRLIIKCLQQTNSVKAIFSASAIGYYGEDKTPVHVFTEKDEPATDFLAETCRQWEKNIEPVRDLGKRLVKFRIGIVLSNDGGALAEFRKPIRLGVAAIMGSGKQVQSWIHIDDLCRMFVYAMENEQLDGVYNAVSPCPVSNEALILSLAAKIKGRYFIPIHVPVLILKLMLGQRSVEVLKSATVSSEKITASGFRFLYPTIDDATEKLK